MNTHLAAAPRPDPRAAGFTVPAWIAAAALLVSFFPNPAFPAGQSTGLQAGTLGALVLLWLRPRALFATTQGWLFGWSVIPVVVAALTVLVLGFTDSPTLVISGTVVMTVALLPLGVSALLLSIPPRLFVRLLLAVVLVHAALSIYQVYSFQGGRFPLLELYNNRSMLTVSDDYARWVRRPTGLFSEPSAMAATLGPWTAIALAYLTHARRARMSPALILFTVATVVGLIVGSQSGYSLWFLPAVGGMGLLQLGRLLRQRGNAWSVGVAFAGALVVAGVAYQTLGGAVERFGRASDQSWSIRSESLTGSVEALFKNTQTLLVGVGPAESPGAMTEQLKFGANMWNIDHASVFSMTGRYVLETGFVGVFAVCGIGFFTIGRILRSGERISGLVCLGLWCVSVGVTTSYFDTPPLWYALGWLAMWDRHFPREDAPPAFAAIPFPSAEVAA